MPGLSVGGQNHRGGTEATEIFVDVSVFSVPLWLNSASHFITNTLQGDCRGSRGRGKWPIAEKTRSPEAARGISGDQAIFFSGNGYIQARSNPVAGRSTVSFSLWFKTDHPTANYKLAGAAWWRGDLFQLYRSLNQLDT